MANKEKKCFVITPIGEDNSEIRRHMDGIIDQAIKPAIGDKFEIIVAHRDYKIGSINDRVIKCIYESDLVIANLTNLNPNVMFELAMRYSFGKPAIVIAQKDTVLPFDITTENTAFYINDPAGANELKNKIMEFEKNIDYEQNTYGPIYKVINNIPIYNAVESGKKVSNEELLSYVLQRLESLDKKMNNQIIDTNMDTILNIIFDVPLIKDTAALKKKLLSIFDDYGIYREDVRFVDAGLKIMNFDTYVSQILVSNFTDVIEKLLEEEGIEKVKFSISKD